MHPRMIFETRRPELPTLTELRTLECSLAANEERGKDIPYGIVFGYCVLSDIVRSETAQGGELLGTTSMA